ncbi:MAG TPA: outer membrane beta-barrel protein [Verrucomicrobiae bacterium]|jgi:opacity protein-like surface antigen|nr:outer membrane beta-barrel protein [Verrucomicrobiae bacterium]
MKSLSKWLSAIVIAGLTTVSSVRAADDSPWYFKGDFGVNIIQDLPARSGGEHGNVSFDVGPRLAVAGGYKLNHCWALELETGYTYNQIEHLSSGNNLIQVPILLNIVYSHAFNDQWSVYGGLGAGAGINTLNTSDEGSDTDLSFDYQASVGLKYAFSQNCAIGLGYKFLGTTENDWKFSGDSLHSDPVMNQSILVSFTVKF